MKTSPHRRRWLALMAAAMLTIIAPLRAGQSAAAGAPGEEEASYVIGSKDVLAISVYGQADLSGKYTVEGDGSIPYALVGRLTAGGMTVRAFETALRDRLAKDYLRNPRVSVSVDFYGSQFINVIGEVRQSGPYALSGGRTELIEILAKAGATTTGEVVLMRPRDPSKKLAPGDDANAQIWRLDLRQLQSGQLDDNIVLRDGDTIIVPKAESAFVYGEVQSPGAYGITRETTVLQVLSLAGGTKETAAMNRIRIVRLVSGKETELKNVKTSDRVLPGDTVIVPQRYL